MAVLTTVVGLEQPGKQGGLRHIAGQGLAAKLRVRVLLRAHASGLRPHLASFGPEHELRRQDLQLRVRRGRVQRRLGGGKLPGPD